MLQSKDSMAMAEGEADRLAPALNNTELLMLMYMELLDKEVVGKQKELMVDTVRGVLIAKVKHMASRAVPEIHFPPGWL
jgi:hypothetical protein